MSDENEDFFDESQSSMDILIDETDREDNDNDGSSGTMSRTKGFGDASIEADDDSDATIEDDSDATIEADSDSDSDSILYDADVDLEALATEGVQYFSHDNYRKSLKANSGTMFPGQPAWRVSRLIEQTVDLMYSIHQKGIDHSTEINYPWMIPIIQTVINEMSPADALEQIRMQSNKDVIGDTDVSKILQADETGYYLPIRGSNAFRVDQTTINVVDNVICGMYNPRPDIRVPVNVYDPRKEDLDDRLRYVLGKSNELHVIGEKVQVIGYLKLPVLSNNSTKDLIDALADVTTLPSLQTDHIINRKWVQSIGFYTDLPDITADQIVDIHRSEFHQCYNWSDANKIFELYNLNPLAITHTIHQKVSKLFSALNPVEEEILWGIPDIIGDRALYFSNRMSVHMGINTTFTRLVKHLKHYIEHAADKQHIIDEPNLDDYDILPLSKQHRLNTGEWLITDDDHTQRAWLDRFGYLTIHDYRRGLKATTISKHSYNYSKDIIEEGLDSTIPQELDDHHSLVHQWVYERHGYNINGNRGRIIPYTAALDKIPLLRQHFMGLHLPNINHQQKKIFTDLLSMTYEDGEDLIYYDGYREFYVACKHIKSWLTQGPDITISKYGKQTLNDWSCKYCGEHLVDREYDWFQGYSFQQPINVDEDIEVIHQLFSVESHEEARRKAITRLSRTSLGNFRPTRSIERLLINEVFTKDMVKVQIRDQSHAEQIIHMLPDDELLVYPVSNKSGEEFEFNFGSDKITELDYYAVMGSTKPISDSKITYLTPKIERIKQFMQLDVIGKMLQSVLVTGETSDRAIRLVPDDDDLVAIDRMTYSIITNKASRKSKKKKSRSFKVNMKEWLAHTALFSDIVENSDTEDEDVIDIVEVKLIPRLIRSTSYSSPSIDILLTGDKLRDDITDVIAKNQMWFSETMADLPCKCNNINIIPSILLSGRQHFDHDLKMSWLPTGIEPLINTIRTSYRNAELAEQSIPKRNCRPNLLNGFNVNYAFRYHDWDTFTPKYPAREIPSTKPDRVIYASDSKFDSFDGDITSQLEQATNKMQEYYHEIELVKNILLGTSDNNKRKHDLHEQYNEESKLMTYHYDDEDEQLSKLAKAAQHVLGRRIKPSSSSRYQSEDYADQRQMTISMWTSFRLLINSMDSRPINKVRTMIGIDLVDLSKFSLHDDLVDIDSLWSGTDLLEDNQRLVSGMFEEMAIYIDPSSAATEQRKALVSTFLDSILSLDKYYYSLEQYSKDLNAVRIKNFTTALKRYERMNSNKHDKGYIKAMVAQGRIPNVIEVIEETDYVKPAPVDDDKSDDPNQMDGVISTRNEDGDEVEGIM